LILLATSSRAFGTLVSCVTGHPMMWRARSVSPCVKGQREKATYDAAALAIQVAAAAADGVEADVAADAAPTAAGQEGVAEAEEGAEGAEGAEEEASASSDAEEKEEAPPYVYIQAAEAAAHREVIAAVMPLFGSQAAGNNHAAVITLDTSALLTPGDVIDAGLALGMATPPNPPTWVPPPETMEIVTRPAGPL